MPHIDDSFVLTTEIRYNIVVFYVHHLDAGHRPGADY